MITAVLSYFLKINLALILFYAFYRLCFTNDTFFRWRRFTLLAILTVGWLYPCIQFSSWMQPQAPLQEAITSAQYMAVKTWAKNPEPAPHYSWFSLQTVVLFYFIIMVFLVIRFLVQLFLLVRLSRISRKIEINGTIIHLLKNKSGPFSFFHWIFIHPHTLEDPEQTREILTHELTHARQRHSIDVLLGELNCILCWINPFAWLIKREIRNNLEYLADHQVVKTGSNTKAYQYRLLSLAHPKMVSAFYTHFNVLSLKNRIKMMNKKRTKKIGRTKYLLFIPLTALLLVISNFETVGRTTANSYDQVVQTKENPSVPRYKTIRFAPPVIKKEAKEKEALQVDTTLSAPKSVRFAPPVIKKEKEKQVVKEKSLPAHERVRFAPPVIIKKTTAQEKAK